MTLAFRDADRTDVTLSILRPGFVCNQTSGQCVRTQGQAALRPLELNRPQQLAECKDEVENMEGLSRSVRRQLRLCERKPASKYESTEAPLQPRDEPRHPCFRD